MITEVKKMIDDYYHWLKERTTFRQIDDWVEITTPYIDRHNDYINIYAKKENGVYILTDDGYTINDLKISGCDLKSDKRQKLLDITLNGFGVKRKGGELMVNCSLQNLSLHKHNIIQAILAVNDLFYLASSSIANIFLEDVENWFNINDIRYTPNVKFTGKSGYDHLFDFVIPKSKIQPERIIKVVNHPDRDSSISLAFAWQDTKNVRPEDSKAYALLNDLQNKTPSKVISALQDYDVSPILWSERDRIKDELVA